MRLIEDWTREQLDDATMRELSSLPEHLSPKCLRYRLLEYCLGPGVNTPDAAPELDTAAVRAIAEQTDRTQIGPPAQFDSWFEVDAYLAITARGYRVRPNYDIAGYRIDLVVDGDQRRVAVECDGDSWDGPETFDRDFARQKRLERCGWTFSRIRGSRFYLDRDGALEELWRTLDEHGIRAGGGTESGGEDAPEAEG